MKYENQTYIKSVKLSGYKSIKDLEVEFLPGMNIIIGENGSGKTNFLEFLEWGVDGEHLNKLSFYDCSSEINVSTEEKAEKNLYSKTKKATLTAKYPYGKNLQSNENILPDIPVTIILTEEEHSMNGEIIGTKVREYDTNGRRFLNPTPASNNNSEALSKSYEFNETAMIRFGIPESIPFLDSSETIKIKEYRFDYFRLEVVATWK